MPWIRWTKQKSSPQSVQVITGANLMQSLLQAGQPVASSCGGDGVCGKCRIEILQGAQNLSAPNEVEKFLAEKNLLKKNERISCQCEVLGDIEVYAKYW